MDGYLSIKSDCVTEIVIQKSRFIARCVPVETEEQALEILDEIRKQYRDATHNCYAYVCGLNTLRFSDDGEPSGTAGVPILEVIRARGLKNCLVVVTRYFGGILLGAGGLVRAYSSSASAVLDKSGVVEYAPGLEMRMKMDYAQYGAVKFYAEHDGEMTVTESEFALDVEITAVCRAEKAEAVRKKLQDLTGGRIRLVQERELLLPFDVINT